MGEKITIDVRDCNGKRRTLEFANNNEVYLWAMDEDEFDEDNDEILVVAQGNLCLYSALQSDARLTCDDLTGFFG